MLMPLEAEGSTGFRIQDSGFRKGKNRGQDSGFGIQGVNNLIPGGRWQVGKSRSQPSTLDR
jgi:hypothetical protein